MAKQQFANNAQTTLSGALPQGGTAMTVSSGTGNLFPSLSAGQYFYVTIYTKNLSGNEQNLEIVKVTGRTGDTFTIERDVEVMTGQAGGLAYDGAASTVYVQMRNTAGTMGNLLQSGDIGTAVQPYDANLPTWPSAVSAAELGYLDGVTSAIQTQLNGKQTKITASGLLKGDGTGGVTAATSSTDYAPATSGAGVLKGNGTGGFSAAVAGTDYLAPAAIGVTVQAYDADLTSWSAVAPSAKQDTLVSGTNIKTVNSTSLLGSGNITTGDVTGQASSVDGEVALFSGTGGKTVKRATGSGLAKLTNGVLSTAVAGTDYQTAQSVTGLVKSSGTTRSAAVAGTDYQAPIGTISGVVKGNGANALTAATAGTDYVAPGTATSFTKPQRPSLSTETAPSTNTVTWDLTTDQIFRINLNANITTFNLTGTLSSLAGNQYQVLVRYNGGSTITWNTNIKWPAGTAPTLTGTSGKVDTFTFVVSSTDGANYYLLNTGKTQNL